MGSTYVVVALLAAGPASAGPQTPGAGQSTTSGPELRLSMDEAVAMALDANLGLQADRLNVDSAAHSVAAARASFLPTLTTSFSRGSARSVPGDFTQGATDISSQSVNVSSSWRQLVPWIGSQYTISWSGSRNSQQGGISSFNPRIGSTFGFNITQPLWRSFGPAVVQAAVASTEQRQVVADLQLEQRLVAMEAQVRLAYLDLVSAREGLTVAEQNMAVRQQSLADARARVAVGAAAQIDVISAEADVASNQEAVLVAQAAIETQEDVLRTLILDAARPDYWAIRIVPTDSVVLEPREVDVDAAIRNALDDRLDVVVQRQQLAIDDLNLEVSRNQTRPDLTLQLNYSASGTGGTRFTFGEGFPPPVVSRMDRSFGSVLGDAFGAAYPQWSVGLNLSYPLGRTSAEAGYAQQTVARRQSDLALQALELSVVQQVRQAARQVENSYQRVLATQAALRSSEQQLEAEQRRFAVGLSTTLELQTRQTQLAAARTSELNATIAYNRALINFERVQRTP